MMLAIERYETITPAKSLLIFTARKREFWNSARSRYKTKKIMLSIITSFKVGNHPIANLSRDGPLLQLIPLSFWADLPVLLELNTGTLIIAPHDNQRER